MIRSVIALACALALHGAGAADASRAPERYVVIVAHNHSLDRGVKPLRYADDDGVRYYELMRLLTDRVALFSVLDDDTARLYPDVARAARPPRADDVFATIERFNREMAEHKKVGRQTELFFIYAGHGDRDAAGEGYVSLLDRKLRRRDLYHRILGPSQASFVHLVIDACKSYYLVNRRGAWQDDSEPDSHDDEIRAFLQREELAAYPNAGVILATSGDQSTHEWERFRGGILSHALRSAISGAADINGDGRIEYSELHAFVAAANARVQHPEARLNIFARPPAADRHQPLIDLRHARAARLLRFGPSIVGRFHLEDERGVRTADLHKAPGVRLDVALDRRRTYYLRKTAGEARIAPGDGRIVVAQLSFRQRDVAARTGSLDRTFRRDLYRLAFSRGFYEGFCAQTGHVPVGGSPIEFVIERVEDSGVRPGARHHLLAGYVASAALLDLQGASHGVQLRYDYGIHRYMMVGATFEYARSAHERAGGASFGLDRLAVLLGAAARTNIASWLSARAELHLGYQGYFGSGPVVINGRRVEGADTLGFRLEAGLGARLRVAAPLFADLRGGVALDLVTVEPEELAHTAPYFAAGLGTNF